MSVRNSFLDIDIGNTRAKWRLKTSEGYLRGDCASDSQALLEVIEKLASHGEPPAEVRIASVKGDDFLRQLSHSLQSQYELPVVAVATGKHSLGVDNSYSDESRMGVDRWCAVVAAVADYREQASEAAILCVVDAGSALTVDIVQVGGEGGNHLGGYIVPGYRMQLDALLGGTGQIEVAETYQPQRVAPGCDTESAVCGGILASLAALVNSVASDLAAEHGQPPKLYLTGGDAQRLLPLLELPAQHTPELVLEGIALLAEAG